MNNIEEYHRMLNKIRHSKIPAVADTIENNLMKILGCLCCVIPMGEYKIIAYTPQITNHWICSVLTKNEKYVFTGIENNYPSK